MRTLLKLNAILAALLFLNASTIAQGYEPSRGQDGDSVSIAAKDFNDNKPTAVSVKKLQQENQRLKQALDQALASLEQTKVNQVNLEKQLEQAATQTQSLREKLWFNSNAFSKFLAKLIASGEQPKQMMVMEHLKQTRNEAAVHEKSYMPVSTELVNKVIELVESDNEEIRKQAIDTLMQISPARAHEAGFQNTPSGYWRPVVSASHRVAQIHEALEHESNMRFDEDPLGDIAQVIRQQYQINFQVDEKDRDKEITLDVRGQSLASALDQLAKKLDLVVAIVGEGVQMLPADHADARSTATFNARGLINGDITLDQLAELASDQVKTPSKVTKIGKYQLIVQATISEQRRVSLVLGSLSTTK
ncbi:MAG: FecR domain-containing protein [Planctomycetota bacterium]